MVLPTFHQCRVKRGNFDESITELSCFNPVSEVLVYFVLHCYSLI